MDTNLTTLIVAAIGAGGLGAVFRELFAGITRLRSGVSLKESRRKDDLVTQRDNALTRANRAEQLREQEASQRRTWQDYAARIRRVAIVNGYDAQLPPEPEMQDTLTAEQMRAFRDEGVTP